MFKLARQPGTNNGLLSIQSILSILRVSVAQDKLYLFTFSMTVGGSD